MEMNDSVQELNAWGLLVFRNRERPWIFAVRSYRWVDRVYYLDESNGQRKIIWDGKYSDPDFSLHEWDPMTRETFSRVKQFFIDAYPENSSTCELQHMFKNLQNI